MINADCSDCVGRTACSGADLRYLDNTAVDVDSLPRDEVYAYYDRGCFGMRSGDGRILALPCNYNREVNMYWALWQNA